MAKERLSHSDYKRIIELSNPSLPDYGVDQSYQASDQRHWTLKCPACGTWTALDKEFPTKLGEEVKIILPRPDGTFFRACPKCEAELDLAHGEWVADFPDRPIHGYRCVFHGWRTGVPREGGQLFRAIPAA
jgi:phage terminase large subunit GpA-like protein